MSSRFGKKGRKCKQCKGDICIHETAKQKESLPIGPSIAEQCMEILNKLLKDKEGTPEDILKLATHDQLFQIGMDPLCLVAAMGNVDVMRRFLDAGSNVNVRSTADASTPLMLATQNRHTEMAELLLKHGADVTAVNMEKNNSFCIAVRTGDAKLVNALWPYRGNLDINHANSDGQTVLHFAAEKLWEACVGFLLTNGAQINRQNNEGLTPLMIAAMKGDAKTVEKFLSSGADYLIEDVTGMTAVCWAFDSQKFDSFNIILGKMSAKDKEQFIKSRTERMKNPSPEHDTESDIVFYEDILIPMFKRLATMKEFRDAILKQKFIPSAVSVFTKLMKQPACVTGICFVVALCMTQHAIVVDEAVVIQFIRCRGPEFLIKALKCYSTTPRTEPETLVACFFPLSCLGQTQEGKEWLEKNSTKVVQHADVKPHYNNVKNAMESFGDKGVAIWTNFWDYFEKMTQYQMDRKMAELLEEEEHEKMMKTKKREKKIQKRQNKRQQRKGVQPIVANDESNAEESTKADVTSNDIRNKEDTCCVEDVNTISRKPDDASIKQKNDDVIVISKKPVKQKNGDVVVISKKPQLPIKKKNDDVIVISKKPIVSSKQKNDDVISKKPPVQFKNEKETNKDRKFDVTFGNLQNIEHDTDASLLFNMELAALQSTVDPNLYALFDMHNENQWVTVQGKKERAKSNKNTDEVTDMATDIEQKLDIDHQNDEVKNSDLIKRSNQRQQCANKLNDGPRWADMVKGNGLTEKEPEPVRIGTYADRVVGKTYDENFPALGGMLHGRDEEGNFEQQPPPAKQGQQPLCSFAAAAESTTTESDDIRSDLTSSIADDCGRTTPSSQYTDSKVALDLSSSIHSDEIYMSPTKESYIEWEARPQKDAVRATNLFDIATRVLFENKAPSSTQKQNENNATDRDFLGLPRGSGHSDFEFLSSAKTVTPNGWNLEEVTGKAYNVNKTEQNVHSTEKGKGDFRQDTFPDLEKRGFSDAVQDWLKGCTPPHMANVTNRKLQDDLHKNSAKFINHIQQSQKKQQMPMRKQEKDDQGQKLLPFQSDTSYLQLPTRQQQEAKHNVAVIQPIGHGANRKKKIAQEFTSRPSNDVAKRDHSHLPFADSLVRNVSTLPTEDEGIWYPSDLTSGSESRENYSINASDQKDLPVFPGFHDDTKPSSPGVPLQQNMDIILQMQLLNYYQAHCKHQGIKGSVYGHDLSYYCSVMGISEEKLKSLETVLSLSDVPHEKKQDETTALPSYRQTHEQGNTDIHHDPAVLMALDQGKHRANIPEQNTATKDIRNTNVAHIKDTKVPDIPGSYVHAQHASEKNGNIQLTQQETSTFQEEMSRSFVKTSPLKWTPRSIRWKEKLSEISRMPAAFLRQIGDIIIPFDYRKRYTIPYSDSSVVLGLLVDGTEVMVQVIDLSRRPITEAILQKLTSPDLSHYFLVKYQAFSIEKDTCFLAMDLHEYTLSEYFAQQQMDLDPLTANKMGWQILKGLGYLHDGCDVIHGNIMPSNVLVDIQGKLRLSEYGLPPPLGSSVRTLFPASPMSADRYCWMPTEIMTESGTYNKQSDVQVLGMLLYYILTGGKHPYGENNLAIHVSIQQNWPDIKYVGGEVNDLLSNMMCTSQDTRPGIGDLLKHPYFWADEKRLRFVLIAGSDVLRDMKLGVPTFGGTGGTMIDIINAVGSDTFANDWMSLVDPVIMKEMRSFRQYKNTLVELVLFVYNCCLHFEKMSEEARDVLDEPCKYFLSKFPALFMSVFSAIKRSERSQKICYKPFF